MILNGDEVWVRSSKDATPPEEGTLITNDRNPDGMYYWGALGEVDADAEKMRFSHKDYFPYLTMASLNNRTKKQRKSSKTTDKAKSVHFLDYKLIQPNNFRPDGGQPTNMSNPEANGELKYHTHQQVTKVQFRWKKEVDEATRVRELRELLVAHGYTVEEE